MKAQALASSNINKKSRAQLKWRWCIRVLALCLLLANGGGLVRAQNFSPQRFFGRYQQSVWTDQHGLPQNGVSTIVQTPDGYLWLATAEGIIRFDGARFTAFDTSNTPELKTNNISSLLATRDGTLWACYSNGLTRIQNGQAKYFGPSEGFLDSRGVSLFEDRAGNVWIGTDGGGFSVFRNGRFTSYGHAEGLPDGRVRAFTQDDAGGIWIGTLGGLFYFKDGKFTSYPIRDDGRSQSVLALCWTRAGTLWVGTESGVTRLVNGRFSFTGLPANLHNHQVASIVEDRDGYVWFGATGSGLYRFKDERFELNTEADGLLSDNLQSIFQSANGDVWLGTGGSGLAVLKEGRMRTYTLQDGLPNEMIGAVRTDGAGNLWVRTRGGLCLYQNGVFRPFTERAGLPVNAGRALAVDRAGNLLALGSGQIWRHENGRFSPYLALGEIAATLILEDRAGRVWVGTSFDGLTVFQNGTSTKYTTRDGLPENFISQLYEDRAGNVWIGTATGISRFSNGQFTHWPHKNGYPGRHTFAITEDRAGTIWLGTDGNGLVRFKDGRFTAITTKDGLYDNLAFQILEDDRGNLWMSGNKGIYRASLRELNDFADGRSKAVNSFAYGSSDGMVSRECNAASPAGWKTPDGRLWFPTIKGVVAVNPQQHDTKAPRVVIEQVSLDGTVQPSGQAIRIAPDQERLEIQYTAISWNRPQQLRFKYQLVGLDQGWTDAGTRRTAYYPHLPPGTYHFRVIADNGEGVWNETGASLQFVVVPPFYRTWWFLSLLTVAIAGLALLGYKWRVHQLERATLEQQEFSRRLINAHEGERQRIAAELHDGLSQSLAIIRQRATICLQAAGDPERQREQMEEIAESATAVIDEVRDIIYDLRPVQLDRLGLINSLREMLEKVGSAHGLTIRHDLEELPAPLPKESENSLYRIVQEAVNNIVRHAHADEASVSLKRAAHSLQLVVADNGRGFVPDASRDWIAGSGLGLTGIHERARLLRGDLLVESAPSQGTTITLTLPLA